MTSRALAWRTVTAERPRAVLAVVGVAVIGALLFDMLLLSRGLLVSLRQMLDTAGYDVRIVASDGFPVRSAILHATQVAGEVARLPEVAEVTIVRTDRAAVLTAGRGQMEVALVNLTEGAERRVWRLVAGQDLGPAVRTISSSPPAVINRGLAGSLGLAPGSTLQLRVIVSGTASALPAITLEVVGIADFQFDAADEYAVATTFDAFQRARASTASDTADLILVASRPQVEPSATAAAIERRRPDVRAYSNEQVVARFDENGFAYFRQISFVLSSITLGFAFLLVGTLLTVSVNQRLGQVAALRALGLPRRRIAAMLAWESALLVGVGGSLSLPTGWLLALQLDRILRQMPNIPDRMHFFVFEPRIALWHLGLLAATGVAAAVYPVWIATRLPIAATLRLETIS
jgi:putative ABC transport system permease protein